MTPVHLNVERYTRLKKLACMHDAQRKFSAVTHPSTNRARRRLTLRFCKSCYNKRLLSNLP